MAKILTKARSMCPELIEAIKFIDRLAYSRRYTQVFNDFIDWLVWQHLFPPSETNPLKGYTEEGTQHFITMYQLIQQECRQRTSLWTRQPNEKHHTPCWYDPLGRMFECIITNSASSRKGQFFTPEPVVDVMTQSLLSVSDKSLQKILDPACGSGRMGLSGTALLTNQGIPCWLSMNDIDGICTKMTAINMCFNGAVGEATCMDGLDIGGASYRFGYRVIPILATVPQEQWEMTQMLTFMKTGQNIRKQYVLLPITYSDTYLKKVNDRLVIELDERQKIAEQEEREQQLQELKGKIQERLSGTLFAGDKSQFENLKLPDKTTTKKVRKKKKSGGEEDTQTSLF